MTPDKDVARHRQALVALDRIDEALGYKEYETAHEATQRLQGHLQELQELTDSE